MHSYEQIGIKVAAKTVVGQGPFSAEMNFYTNEDSMFIPLSMSCLSHLTLVPDPPLTIKATVENATTVLLTWSQPQLVKGSLTEYQVIYLGYGRLAVSYFRVVKYISLFCRLKLMDHTVKLFLLQINLKQRLPICYLD